MKAKIYSKVLEERDYQALAAALAAIQAPRITKDPKEIGKKKIEPAKHMSFDALLQSMGETNRETSRSERDSMLLATMLVLLDSVGAIEVNQTICAVTEPAGHLLHSLGHFLKDCTATVDCYRPIQIDPYEEDERKNPFLHLARQAEEHRIAWAELIGKDIQPIREQKIISVLIKGERTIPTKMNGKETVYLHVWKEGYNAYALIGSEQIRGQSPKDAAYRALKEDLELPRDEEIVKSMRLQPSGVEDISFVDYAPTRGAYTRYSFNLFWVYEMDGELKVENELKPRWLTYEEICRGKTRTGEKIITRTELVQAIDLDKVPVVIADVRPFDKSLSEQVKDLLREIKDIRRPLTQLSRSVGLIILSVKWWLLLLLGIILSAILLSPIIDRKLPGLSNVSDLLGIISFIASLVGLAMKLQKSRR
jgi:hypothetical protein